LFPFYFLLSGALLPHIYKPNFLPAEVRSALRVLYPLSKPGIKCMDTASVLIVLSNDIFQLNHAEGEKNMNDELGRNNKISHTFF
jgi:hypothetical protein